MTARKLKHDEYRCAACGRVFNKGVSDEEALAEKEDLFPSVPVEACDLVCDDCFAAFGKKADPDERRR
jgi:hypothetical protein